MITFTGNIPEFGVRPYVLVYRDGEYAVAVDENGQTIAKSTDHAKVIQKAVNYGGNEPVRIFLLGRFYIDKTIELRENIAVEGPSSSWYNISASLLLTADVPLFKILGQRNVTIKNLSIGAEPVGIGTGIQIERVGTDGPTNIYIENLRIHNFRTGIRFVSCGGTQVLGCVRDCWICCSEKSLDIQGAHNLCVENCYLGAPVVFERGTTSVDEYDENARITFINCNIDAHSAYDYCVILEANQPKCEVTFIGCNFEHANVAGIVVKGGSFYTVKIIGGLNVCDKLIKIDEGYYHTFYVIGMQEFNPYTMFERFEDTDESELFVRNLLYVPGTFLNVEKTITVGTNNTYSLLQTVFKSLWYVHNPIILIEISGIDTTAGESIYVSFEARHYNLVVNTLEKGPFTSDGVYALTPEDIYTLMKGGNGITHLRAAAKSNLASTNANVTIKVYAPYC